MTLDELLAQAAPPVAPRTPELTHALRELAPATEPAARAGRRHGARATVAGAVVVLAVLGAGGAAAAHGLLPGWFPWTTDAGSSCGLQASVALRRDGAGALITDRWSAAEQRQALASAEDYLGSLDLDAIDRKQAAEHWFTYLEDVSATHPSRRELEAKFRGERLEVHALLYEVDRRVDAHLTAHGYDPDSVMTDLASECAQ